MACIFINIENFKKYLDKSCTKLGYLRHKSIFDLHGVSVSLHGTICLLIYFYANKCIRQPAQTTFHRGFVSYNENNTENCSKLHAEMRNNVV